MKQAVCVRSHYPSMHTVLRSASMRPTLDAAIPLRRAVLLASAATVVLPSLPAQAASRAELRVADDLKRRADEVRRDVAYPPAVMGKWLCSRQIRRVEGNLNDAEYVWRALGGNALNGFRTPESFEVQFIPIPDARRNAMVIDRGYEYAQRSGLPSPSVEWSAEQPDFLRARSKVEGSTSLLVVQRMIQPFEQEPPYGFGFSELIRISQESSGGSAAAPNVKLARVIRRLVPTDDSLEGTELISTYASEDEAAFSGGAKPTSRLSSSFRLTRPLASGGSPAPRRASAPRMAAAPEDAAGESEDDADDTTSRAAYAGQDGDGNGDAGDDSATYRYNAEGLAKAAIRFETRATEDPATSMDRSSGAQDDDVAGGLREVADVGGRGLGVLGLGLEIGISGISSPIGIAFFGLFGALVFAGEFGSTGERFLTTAQVTDESGYYKPLKVLPEQQMDDQEEGYLR